MENVKEKAVRNSWFNVKLYLDGIKQLKLIGIMGAIIMACAAFLIPMGMNIDNAEYVKYIKGEPVGGMGIIRSYNILDLNPIIILTFCILVPLMTLYLFHFLNKRNACDFYHSIPDKRESLFISYGASILTWHVGLIVESMLISLISCGVFRYVEFEAEYFGVVFCTLFAAGVFMYGVFTIAMSITGTSFTNFAVAAMILVVPRLMVTIFMALVSESIDIIPFHFGGSILDDRLNVVTNMFTGVLIRGEYEGIFMWSSAAYTFVAGLIYCVLGGFLFKKRKSEAATCAAINSKLQCVLRLIPAMVICLIPITIIYECIIGIGYMEDITIFGIVVLYVIAVIAYFMYELITTRKLYNVIKAFKGLIWLVAFNVVFMAAIFVCYKVMLNDVPDALSVDSVSLEIREEYDYVEDDYYRNKISKITLNSQELKEIIISELSRNVQAIKADANLWKYNIPENIETFNYYRNNRAVLQVEIDCGLRSIYRKIYLSQPAYEQITKILSENEQIGEVLYTAVEFKEIASVYLYGISMEIPLEEAYKIYTTFVEELKQLEMEDAFNLCIRDIPPAYDTIYYDTLQIVLKNGEKIDVRISDAFPETLKRYIGLINEKAQAQMEPMDTFFMLYDEWNQVKDTERGAFDGHGRIYLEVVEGTAEYTVSAYFSGFKSEDGQAIQEESDFSENGEMLLREIKNKLAECELTDKIEAEAILEVSFEGSYYAPDSENNKYYDVIKYYRLDEELIDLIRAYGGYEEQEEYLEMSGYFQGWRNDNSIEICTAENEYIVLEVTETAMKNSINKAEMGDILYLRVKAVENGTETSYAVNNVYEIIRINEQEVKEQY